MCVYMAKGDGDLQVRIDASFSPTLSPSSLSHTHSHTQKHTYKRQICNFWHDPLHRRLQADLHPYRSFICRPDGKKTSLAFLQHRSVPVPHHHGHCHEFQGLGGCDGLCPVCIYGVLLPGAGALDMGGDDRSLLNTHPCQEHVTGCVPESISVRSGGLHHLATDASSHPHGVLYVLCLLGGVDGGVFVYVFPRDQREVVGGSGGVF